MANHVDTALRFAQELRTSRGFRQLEPAARNALERDLQRLETTLGKDPYAQSLDVTDLENRLRQSAGGGSAPDGQGGSAPQPQQAPPPQPPPTPQTATIGQRAAEALEAVNFPGFVASLLTGTFQAIVDASVQQVREYARLVASISQSLDDFTRDNVTLNQARDHLAEQYPQDLVIGFPPPGHAGNPRLLPRAEKAGQSPAWLAKYGLEGEELSEELTEGPLLQAGQRKVGEERIQTLATMVLMGINRVVVNEGDVSAKLQFHAAAHDVQKAEMQQMAGGFAARDPSGAGGVQMMVSTLKANAQADASIKADLMGEVRISFRSETFPLESFASTAAIQLINKHARWRGDAAANGPAPAASAGSAPAATAAPAPSAPAPASGGTK